RRVTLMHLEFPVQVGVRSVAHVGDHTVRFPGALLAGAAGGQAKALVLTGALDGLDHRLWMELRVAVAARGQRVGADSQAVAFLERIVGNALERLGTGAA